MCDSDVPCHSVLQSISHSYLPPPIIQLIFLSLPPTIDRQQYIFAVLSISHIPKGHQVSERWCTGAVEMHPATKNSPGSEGKTFLSCSMTSWSCSTVSCSCSRSSPDTHTEAGLPCYRWMRGRM